MQQECLICHTSTVKKLINKFKPEANFANLLLETSNELLQNKMVLDNPNLATQIHHLARNILGVDDLFKEEKYAANELLLSQYSYYKKMVLDSDKPFDLAVKLAVAGNIIDYGAHSVPTDIEQEIHQLLQYELAIDNTAELQTQVLKAKSVLYLGDNAGEIVFDKLLIETMQNQT